MLELPPLPLFPSPILPHFPLVLPPSFRIASSRRGLKHSTEFLNVLEMVTIEHLGSASLFFQRFLDEYSETQSHAFRIEAIFLGKLEQSESQLFSF